MKHYNQRNKKRSYILLTLILLNALTTYGSSEHKSENESQDEHIQISPLTNQVHSRFYVITRIEHTIQALYQLHSTHKLQLPKAVIAHLQSLDQFENKEIRQCLRDLIKTQSLQPLFNCWQTIITYKFVDDAALPVEFSQLMYHLLNQLINHAKSSHKKVFKELIAREIELPLASTHQVSFRFYLLKRLTQTHTILQEHTSHKIELFPDQVIFVNPHVAHCYANMQETQSIKPLAQLFDQVQQYRFINDTLFMQEFLQLIFIAHVCLVQSKEVEELAHSFEHISSLSITELLEAIDIQISKYDHKNHTVHIMLEENFDFSPNHFAHYVYRRFYFIQRLERIMSIFKEVEQTLELSTAQSSEAQEFAPIIYDSTPHTVSFNPATMFDFSASFSFKHKRIQESIRIMEHDHSLKPLFTVWDDFITYKSIKDQLFVEEFTKEIFVISRNMLICSGICARHLPPLRSTIGLPAQQLLDVIDLYMEQFLEHTPTHNSTHLETAITPIRMPDLQPSVHIDDVILRFYHIQRLGIIFWLLNEIQEKKISLHLSYATTLHGVLIDSHYHFTHEHIVSVIKIMEQTDSIEPLMGLLQGVQRYKYIEDELFAREYLTLTLITLEHLKIRFPHKRSAEQFNPLEDFPLEKILNALDLIAKELPALLEKYELNAELEWKSWVKKYWWAPIVIAGTLLIKVALLFRETQLPPKPDATRPTPAPHAPVAKLSAPPASNPTPANPKQGIPLAPPPPPVPVKPKINAPKMVTQLDLVSDEE